jgi:hypothetical protein
MDEAFLPFAEIVRRTIAIKGEFVDQEAGVHSYICGLEVEMPVEVDIGRDGDGGLRIGSVPPLYYADTTFRPSYHRLKITAVLKGEADDG